MAQAKGKNKESAPAVPSIRVQTDDIHNTGKGVIIGPLFTDFGADEMAKNVFRLLYCIGVRVRDVAQISLSASVKNQGYARVSVRSDACEKYLMAAFQDPGSIMNHYDLRRITRNPRRLMATQISAAELAANDGGASRQSDNSQVPTAVQKRDNNQGVLKISTPPGPNETPGRGTGEDSSASTALSESVNQVSTRPKGLAPSNNPSRDGRPRPKSAAPNGSLPSDDSHSLSSYTTHTRCAPEHLTSLEQHPLHYSNRSQAQQRRLKDMGTSTTGLSGSGKEVRPSIAPPPPTISSTDPSLPYNVPSFLHDQPNVFTPANTATAKHPTLKNPGPEFLLKPKVHVSSLPPNIGHASKQNSKSTDFGASETTSASTAPRQTPDASRVSMVQMNQAGTFKKQTPGTTAPATPPTQRQSWQNSGPPTPNMPRSRQNASAKSPSRTPSVTPKTTDSLTKLTHTASVEAAKPSLESSTTARESARMSPKLSATAPKSSKAPRRQSELAPESAKSTSKQSPTAGNSKNACSSEPSEASRPEPSYSSIQLHAQTSTPSVAACGCPETIFYHVHQFVGTETRHAEFKRGGIIDFQRNFRKMVGKYMCGFLNSEGGTIYFGVTDDGRVRGIKATESLQTDLRSDVHHAACYLVKPAVDPSEYSVHFAAVMNENGRISPKLKVMEVCVKPRRTERRPQRYSCGGVIYVRRDGSLQSVGKADN